MTTLSQEAQHKGLDYVEPVGGSLALGVEVLDAGHVADGLDHPVRLHPRAGRHLAGTDSGESINTGDLTPMYVIVGSKLSLQTSAVVSGTASGIRTVPSPKRIKILYENKTLKKYFQVLFSACWCFGRC